MSESLKTTVWRKILICDILLSSTGKLSLLPRFTFKPETTGRHSKNHPRGAVAVSVKVHKSKQKIKNKAHFLSDFIYCHVSCLVTK